SPAVYSRTFRDFSLNLISNAVMFVAPFGESPAARERFLVIGSVNYAERMRKIANGIRRHAVDGLVEDKRLHGASRSAVFDGSLLPHLKAPRSRSARARRPGPLRKRWPADRKRSRYAD